MYPHGLRDKVLSVLVNYQDPREKQGIATKLPKWSTNPTWAISIKYGSQITIEGTEPYFSRHDKSGKFKKPVNKGVPSVDVSAGYYIIGLHSFEDCTFSIEANVVKRMSAPVGQGGALDI